MLESLSTATIFVEHTIQAEILAIVSCHTPNISPLTGKQNNRTEVYSN